MMKITKKHLQRVINEEIDKIFEESGKSVEDWYPGYLDRRAEIDDELATDPMEGTPLDQRNPGLSAGPTKWMASIEKAYEELVKLQRGMFDMKVRVVWGELRKHRVTLHLAKQDLQKAKDDQSLNPNLLGAKKDFDRAIRFLDASADAMNQGDADGAIVPFDTGMEALAKSLGDFRSIKV